MDGGDGPVLVSALSMRKNHPSYSIAPLHLLYIIPMRNKWTRVNRNVCHGAETLATASDDELGGVRAELEKRKRGTWLGVGEAEEASANLG